MSILSRATSGLLEKRMPAPPGSLWGDSTPPTNGSLARPVAGTTVTERSALGLAAVWASVGVISDGVATLPIRQYRGTGPERVEVDPSPVIVDPCSEIHQIDFMAAGTASLALRGNFFGQITSRDRKLFPTQIVPLDPDTVRVKRDRVSGLIEYRIGGKPVDVDDIFHVRNLMRPGAAVGMNPIEELRVTFGLAQAAQEYGAAFFANSANASGFIVSEEDLDAEETLNLARQWMSMHQGINQAHLPAVLTGGLSWHQISINPEDAQFIESRQLGTSEVAMIFRVPPHMIGDVDRSTSWGAGIEQQEMGWVRGGLSGYIRRWETSLSSLVPPGEHVEFDLRRRLRGDSVQRSAVIVNLRNAGIINADEARVLYEDLPPLPDEKGTAYLQPLNMGEAGTPVGVPLPKGSASAVPMPETAGMSPFPQRAPVVNVAAQPPAPITVNNYVQPPEVRVDAPPAPDVHMHQGEIRVAAPKVTVSTPPVNVTTPEVRVSPTLHVDMPSPRRTRRVSRDDEGRITEVTEEDG